MSEVLNSYRQALKDRRAGIESTLGSDDDLVDVKPEFYADARMLSEEALKVFNGLPSEFPPYGLVNAKNEAAVIDSKHSMVWVQLAQALKSTGHYVVEQAEVPIESCPYHEVLAQKIGATAMPLKPFDHNERGIDTFREVTSPGAELNAPLFTSLLRRLPEIQKLHGSTTDPETFARRSVSLLREPLNHPQQYAQAFVLSLGTLRDMAKGTYLNDGLALGYTKVEYLSDGSERLAWAMPTENFTLKEDVSVVSRVIGSERNPTEENTTKYPRGTRLGDIEIDEPTIGCPGNQLAFAMWDRTIDVIIAENLWDNP